MLTLEAPVRSADQWSAGAPTLDEVIAAAWEGLTARRVVACVVCGAPMEPVHEVGAHAVAGRCHGCGCALG